MNRMSEQKNVSPDMVPADRTILCVELSCWRDEPMWKASDEEIYRVALARRHADGLRRDGRRGRGLPRY